MTRRVRIAGLVALLGALAGCHGSQGAWVAAGDSGLAVQLPEGWTVTNEPRSQQMRELDGLTSSVGESTRVALTPPTQDVVVRIISMRNADEARAEWDAITDATDRLVQHASLDARRYETTQHGLVCASMEIEGTQRGQRVDLIEGMCRDDAGHVAILVAVGEQSRFAAHRPEVMRLLGSLQRRA